MGKPTKVLHLIPRFVFSGAEMLVLEYARRLDREKYEMRVMAVRKGGGLEVCFKEAGVDTFAVSRRRDGGGWWQWQMIKKYAKEFQPDIIHSHVFSGDFFAFLLKKFVFPQIKWISTQHNVEFKTPWYRRWIWRIILQKADSVIAVSEEVKNYVHEYFGVSKDKMELVPNGIALEKWLEVPKAKFVQDKELKLATIGRLEYQKGQEYLLQALAGLKDVPWKLDVYGEGSLEIYLKELAKKLGISSQICWHGIETEIEKKIKEANFVVQPSLWEGMSLVVMESMAAGRLVIATQAAGKDLIKHGENGCLVPAKDTKELARVIKYYFEHPEEADRLADNARAYACAHFDIREHILAVEEIYEELTKTKLTSTKMREL